MTPTKIVVLATLMFVGSLIVSVIFERVGKRAVFASPGWFSVVGLLTSAIDAGLGLRRTVTDNGEQRLGASRSSHGRGRQFGSVSSR